MNLLRKISRKDENPPSFWRRIRNRFFVADSFYGALKPLFILTYGFGVTPFRILTDDRGMKEIRHSPMGYLIAFINVTIFWLCCAYTTYHNESIIGFFLKNDVSSFGNNLHAICLVFGCSVAFLTGVCLKSSVLKFFHICWEIDLKLSKNTLTPNYSSILCFVIIVLLLLLLICFVEFGVGVYCLYSMDVNPTPYLLIQFGDEILGIAIVVAQFCLVMKSFQRRYDLLHSVLKNLGQQWSRSSITTIRSSSKQHSLKCLNSFSMYTIVTKNPSEIIQESMEIHELICEAASTANKYFTYQLLTIISIAFLIIVFDAYYVLETLLGKSKRESKFKTVEFVTFFSCQMILYIIVIIAIVEGSNRVIQKSEKTGGIVHSLLNRTKDPETKEKLQQFSMQLLHLKINFTAAGLFNVDRSLYFTISGALTTYLIILLQFTSNATPNAVNQTSEAFHTINGSFALEGP